MSFSITAKTASEVCEPAPRRDLIGSLLFYRMDWCEKRPSVMFGALGVLIVLAGVLESLMP